MTRLKPSYVSRFDAIQLMFERFFGRLFRQSISFWKKCWSARLGKPARNVDIRLGRNERPQKFWLFDMGSFKGYGWDLEDERFITVIIVLRFLRFLRVLLWILRLYVRASQNKGYLHT